MLNIVSDILNMTKAVNHIDKVSQVVLLLKVKRMAVFSDQLVLCYRCINPEIFPNILCKWSDI